MSLKCQLDENPAFSTEKLWFIVNLSSELLENAAFGFQKELKANVARLFEEVCISCLRVYADEVRFYMSNRRAPDKLDSDKSHRGNGIAMTTDVKASELRVLVLLQVDFNGCLVGNNRSFPVLFLLPWTLLLPPAGAQETASRVGTVSNRCFYCEKICCLCSSGSNPEPAGLSCAALT